jgi:hypothetical protein
VGFKLWVASKALREVVQYCWTSGSTSLVSKTMGLTVYELPCRIETWYARNQNGGNKGTRNCDRRFEAEQQDMNYRTTW